jgi:transcriptional regulator with XRE-family HTH domain
MPLTKKRLFSSHLAEIRKSKQISLQQIASLLGHSNTSQISRFERGLRVPDLKSALKLAQIYDMPIRVMLDEYYFSCRREIEQEKRKLTSEPNNENAEDTESSNVDFCSYDRLLTSAGGNEADLLKVRRHVAYLMRRSAELLGHI